MVETALYEGLIFDLDGTLWSTAEVCARAWNRAQQLSGVSGLRELGVGDVQAVTGLVQAEIFRRLYPGLDEATRARLEAICLEQEEHFLDREGGALYPDVRAGLERLRAHYRMAIVSNCQVGYIERFLAKNALGGLFCDFECYGNTLRPKSDNIASVVKRLGLSTAVYVGDTHTDGNSAREAGLPFYWVEYGFGRAVPSDRSFASFGELVAHLIPSEAS